MYQDCTSNYSDKFSLKKLLKNSNIDDNGFYSIDKLVEFGLGMSMAQQMIQMMNQTMKQMYVPGSLRSMSCPQLQSFYVVIDGKSVGPLTEGDFSRLVTDKKLTKDSLAWMPGMLDWQPIEKVPDILKIVALAPPPIPSNL